MGEEVARLHRRASVEAEAVAQDDFAPRDDFGTWLARERRLRGISVGFVAARLKLPATRVAAIESGETPLGRDGRSRSTARALALAIGADPGAALARLQTPNQPKALRLPARRVFTGAATGTALLGLVALTGLGIWALLTASTPETGTGTGTEDLVYRPDYVGELLTGEESGSLEGPSAVRHTGERP